ncbi:MAG: hypothetical protein GWM90_30655, partial [Gemmatimonadetes bacterium]|nr:hypothetical protein [Gemmatimonadota bacterium]NIU79757.1 hypothetical protein [Gammaproteobacteria bacterium]NIX48266.1 hypothetical protein [Gemmatimonadota bacterium]NIY12713.1 hypothetical protein [Gemmatimonadota bacterium]
MKRMLWALPAALVVLGGGWMVRADGAGAYLEPAASVRAYALGSAPASETRPAAVH